MFNQRRTEPRAIQQRIETERRRAEMSQAINGEFKLMENANWEKKTAAVMRKNHIHNIARHMEERDEQALKDRRQRLQDLLQKEERQHKAEMDSMNETSIQRATRLVNRAKQLKEDREARRLAFANKKWQEQWRRDCDDLRTIESDKFRGHVYDVVEQQKQDHVNAAQKYRQEEAKWAEEWEEDRVKALAKSAAEERRRKEVNEEEQRIILEHMAKNRAKRDGAKQAQREELERFTRQMEIDAAKEQERRIENEAKTRLQNEAVKKFNQEFLANKEAAARAKMESERNEMRQKMREYEHDLEEQNLDKERIQQEMREYHIFLQRRKEEEKIMEAEMERLTQQELDRANADRDKARIANDLARERLMQDVLRTRDIQIKEREIAKEAYAQEMVREAENLEKELELAKLADGHETAALARKEEQHRRDLQKQLEANRIRREGEALRLQQAREAANHAEAVYRAFLEKEKRETGAWKKPNHGLCSTKLQFDRPY